jgi:two-component system, OmpR family, phosphate regulon response regulator PhoB
MAKNKPRILVIEDNQDILQLYSIILSSRNYEVLGKENFADADAVIKDFSPSVIILDMLLSGVSGLDICRRLKSNPSTSHIPVIMVSAHSSGKEKCMDAGADFYVAKPFEMVEFLSTIERAVNSSDKDN